MKTQLKRPVTRVRYDKFVERVRPDPESNKQPLFFTGYVGKASRSGHYRVYFSAALTQYVEIKKADVLYALPNTEVEDTLGGSKFWIEKDAELYFGNDFLETKTKEAFVEGELMNYYQTRMFAGMERQPAMAPGAAGMMARGMNNPELAKMMDMGMAQSLNAGIGCLCYPATECNNNTGCLGRSVACIRTNVCHYGTDYVLACEAGSVFDINMAQTAVINPGYYQYDRYAALQRMFN